MWLDESGCQCEVGHGDRIALTRGVPPSRTEPQPTTPPLELVFTLCWRCTKASLLALVTEMRNLANKEERNTKVNQLGRLAFEILPSSLSDGYVDSRDIEALRNQKGVGEWSVEQLQQLRDSRARFFVFRARAPTSWRCGLGSRGRGRGTIPPYPCRGLVLGLSHTMPLKK